MRSQTRRCLPACHDLVPVGEGGMGVTASGYVKDAAIGTTNAALLAGNAPFPNGANLANPRARAQAR